MPERFRLGICAAACWLICTAIAVAGEPPWKLASPGWHYEFPRDHGNHADFKTEWWYFTGNLRGTGGREFGYQLTFFRQGMIPPGERRAQSSRFITNDLKFAHFAISDLSRSRFFYEQILSRGAFGEAGFGEPRLAWIGDCSVELLPNGDFHLVGRDAEKSLDLTLHPSKPPVIHGSDGVSQKADGAGRASHYYSLTRLETRGSVGIGKEKIEVAGLSWFDHEWATNQLGKQQVGWDWFSLQFEDGAELMLFQIRTEGGGRDRWSGGSWIDLDGKITRIGNDDFTLEPSSPWKSKVTGASYPLRWRIRIPKLDFEATVDARQPDQELKLSPVAYWEGAVRASGKRAGRDVRGSGYLEMTGYSGAVVGLHAPE
jgi:predicted secreted hydrolase